MQPKPKMVEKEYTLVAYLYYTLYGFIICFFLSAFTTSLLGNKRGLALISLFVVSIFILVYLLWRRLSIKRFLHKRDEDIQSLALQNTKEASYSPMAANAAEFDQSSIWTLATRDAQVRNYLKTADWSYVDLSYGIYQQTKNGDYKKATIFYAVMATELPRALPNVLFDSKKDRGRQFKVKFDPKQLCKLEGNFNEYFDTYFAEGYTIDSMSFITPDVMQAMIAADDYDIEIINNKLMLYGPLEPANAQLQTMSQLVANIKKTLMVTASSYHDDRAGQNIGAAPVAPAGMFLKRRRTHITIGTIILVIYFVVYLAISVKANH